MKFIYDDGGRSESGFKGSAGDCVCRAIAIAAQIPYNEAYEALASGSAGERITKHNRKRGRVKSARMGILVGRKWFKEYMGKLGWKWTPTMGIGTGCKVHLHDGELPMGRLIVSVSKHYTTVIDGVIHDTHDPQREATVVPENGIDAPRIARRCVYGYWSKV
jgi:hypothetical protein